MTGSAPTTLIHSVRVVGAGANTAAGTGAEPTERPDGWVLFAEGTVRQVGAGAYSDAAASASVVVDAAAVAGPGAILSPGLVDIHVHGGGGVAFDDGPDAIAAAAEAHRRAGTTRVVASLVSAPVPDLVTRLRRIGAARATVPGLVGAHLEGPYLSPAHAGAHTPDALGIPTDRALDELLGTGVVRQVTIAPELPGAMAAIGRIVEAGATAAIGHTHADSDVAHRAFDAGARLVTHAFNAMPPLHHRAPGVVGAALTDPRITLEAIPDGHHLHGDVLRMLFAAAPARIALVTDAMAAAGCGDGRYRLGALDVEVRAGAAHLHGSDTLAGSTITLADGVRRAHALGLPLAAVLRAATSTPARALGLPHLGSLAPGAVADAVLWDADLTVRGVWQDGIAVPPGLTRPRRG